MLFMLMLASLSAQDTDEAPAINWQNWQSQTAPEGGQKTIIYLYTDWCNLCKKLEREAFQDSSVLAILSENYLTIKLDAVTKTDLDYKGETYSYVRKGKLGYHELAAKLLEGQLSFPSFVFLDEEQNLIQVIHGYQDIDYFLTLLNYYGRDHYLKTPWRTFQRQFSLEQLAEKG